MLWTDASSREFIANNYPWFLDTFDDYTYPIQRADAIRYFVLHHYGGIYLDLDVGCLRPLDPLLIYPVILPKTIPVGVSNDLIFAEKGHSLFDQAIHNLIAFDHSWVLNYPTVMFSTGPMFLSAQYGLYTSSHPSTFVEDIRILPKSLYGKNAKEGEAPHSFFSHYYGSSWHADDAGFIFGLYTWGKGLMWVGLVVLIVGIFWLPTKKRRYSLRRMGGYEVLFRRTGWHFHLGGPSESSTQPSSPDISSEDNSPIDGDGDVPVLHLPFDVRPGSPSSSSEASTMAEPYAGRVNSPIVEAFQRIRNRVASLASPREEVQRSPVRPRRQQYSRGVLFFLPAIFTQSQDIELTPATLIPPRVAASTSRASQLRPPEKPRYTEDLESAGDLRRDIPEGLRPHDGTLTSSRSSHEDLAEVDDLPSRPHSRSSSSSRRSSSRPLISWDS
jgi:inositol phosphorylceramide mannosyltransferase catalytic subunit